MYLSWLKKYNLLIFDEIDSTNSEAIRIAKTGPEGNFIIWAKSQTAGRGRYGKNWQSEAGNLYVSLLLNNIIKPGLQPQLSFVTAIALYETIAHLAKGKSLHINLGLKWPNDVLINDKKVAGILLESINLNERNFLIIGVGVNIKVSPNNIEQPTTSLKKEGITTDEPDKLLNLFMNYFEKHFLEWKDKSFIKTRLSWLKRASKLNKIITIDDGKTRISGEFKDIDFNGNLSIRIGSGQIYNFSAGEVFFGEKASEKLNE